MIGSEPGFENFMTNEFWALWVERLRLALQGAGSFQGSTCGGGRGAEGPLGSRASGAGIDCLLTREILGLFNKDEAPGQTSYGLQYYPKRERVPNSICFSPDPPRDSSTLTHTWRADHAWRVSKLTLRLTRHARSFGSPTCRLPPSE